MVLAADDGIALLLFPFPSLFFSFIRPLGITASRFLFFLGT
jgi:hypothetical protein